LDRKKNGIIAQRSKTMYETEDILQAARAIRPRLNNLLGTEAETVAQQLDKLLAQADTGQVVGDNILELLSEYQATRQEMNARLSKEEFKNYSPLNGDSSKPVATSEYICPDKAGCTCGKYPTGWDRHSIEDAIPNCPNLNKALIPN